MIPADDLQRLREVWDQIPPPSEEQRQRARHRLLSAMQDTKPARHVTSSDPTPVQTATRATPRRETGTGGRRRRLIAAIAVAALLLAVLGISWQAVRALRSEPLPVIDKGEPDIPVPTEPLPLRTEPEVDITRSRVRPDVPISVTTFVPDASGPWPVVVLVPRWGPNNGPEPPHDEGVPMATAIAERGAVVHVVKGMNLEFSPDAVRDVMASTACALRYARATAPALGALEDRLVLVGYDVGAWSGALVALTDPADLPTGPCTAPDLPAPATAFVGFAGVYGCHTSGCAHPTPVMRGLIPGEHAQQRPDVPFRLVAPSHSSYGAPAEDEAFGAALRAAGHPVQVQVVAGASPGDFLTPGTAASDTTIEHVLDVARQ